ncbi:MAG: DUF3368 domain-containing protein [Bacteroidota bacterium]
MERRWVFDASPLIALGKIGLLDTLKIMAARRVIPEAVAAEVDAGRVQDPAKRWLGGTPEVEIVPVTVRPSVLPWGLGAGESAAISFAAEHPGFRVVLDERAARACAKALGVHPLGTLGILTLAKRQGVVAEVRPLIDALLAAEYRLAPALIDLVLRDAGES